MNVVFDLGAVVFEWQPARLLARVLPAHTATPEATRALQAAFFQGYGGEWGEFDRGTIDEPALVRGIAGRTGLTPDEVSSVVDGVSDELKLVPATVALIDELRRAGHRLFYLSNMPAPYAAQLTLEHPFDDWFEDGVFSSDVQLVKPDLAIFRAAEARFGVLPADCLFLDDHPANVAAARAAGWQALHFVDAAQARRDVLGLSLL